MNHFIKENWFKIGTVLLVLIAACAVSYYYLGFKPQQDEAVLQQQAATQNQAQVQKTQDATLFNEKLACENMRSKVDSEIKTYNASQQLKYGCYATDPCGSYISNEQLYTLFYAPSLDTCIDVVISRDFFQATSSLVTNDESYGFNDAFTGEYKDWIDTIKHGEPYFEFWEVLQKIDQYQSTSTFQINPGVPPDRSAPQ
jgi:hypothetical protein